MDPWSSRRDVARGVLRSSPKPEKKVYFCHWRGIDNFCRRFLHSSAQMCLYQTPGRRPSRVTGRYVNTVTSGWVGAPNEPRSDFMAQSLALSIDVCPGLGISPLRIKHLAEFFSGQSWPNICPGMIFVLFFFFKSETIFWKICAHSERYRNLLAGIVKNSNFWGNIALPLLPF